jgi:hypothetical protein
MPAPLLTLSPPSPSSFKQSSPLSHHVLVLCSLVYSPPNSAAKTNLLLREQAPLQLSLRALPCFVRRALQRASKSLSSTSKCRAPLISFQHQPKSSLLCSPPPHHAALLFSICSCFCGKGLCSCPNTLLSSPLGAFHKLSHLAAWTDKRGLRTLCSPRFFFERPHEIESALPLLRYSFLNPTLFFAPLWRKNNAMRAPVIARTSHFIYQTNIPRPRRHRDKRRARVVSLPLPSCARALHTPGVCGFISRQSTKSSPLPPKRPLPPPPARRRKETLPFVTAARKKRLCGVCQ